MKKAGIVLIVLDVLVMILGFITGKSVFLKFLYSNEPGVVLIAEVIGFLSPSIVGIILISKANKRAKASGGGKSAATTPSTSSATYSPGATAGGTTARFCPKCGGEVEADDAFCVNCGAKL